MWSEIVITFVLRKRQTIEYKTQLAAKASIPEYMRNAYIYITAIYLKTGVPENPLADGPQT